MVDIVAITARDVLPGLVAIIGDSRPVCHATTGVTNQKQVGSLTPWFEFFSKGRFRLDPAYDKAVGGSTVQATIAQMQAVIAMSPRPAFAFILTGTNTFNGGGSVASAWADLQTTISMAIAAGIKPIVVLDLPRQQSTFSPGAAAGRRSCHFNQLIRDNASRLGYVHVDLTPVLADPASATGDPLAGLYGDGIHLSQKGAVLAGKEAAAYFAEFGRPYRGYGSARDDWHATDNPLGNLAIGGLMQGSGGSNAGTGSSGTVATGWKNSVNGGTGTAVASVVPRTEGGAGNWQQLVITSSGAAVDVRFLPAVNLTVGFAAGEQYVMEADIEIEAATGLRQITAQLTAYAPGFVVEGRGQYTSPVSTDVFPDGAHSGRFRTPPVLVTSATTYLQPEIDLLTITAGGSATIRIGAVSVRKVG